MKTKHQQPFKQYVAPILATGALAALVFLFNPGVLSGPAHLASVGSRMQNATDTPPVPRGTVVTKSIVVANDKTLTALTEGDVVSFSATLVMPDGSKLSGPDAVTWLGLGQIGSIEESGTFRAKLESTVSELGKAPGAIVAIYQNPDGSKIIGASPIFWVNAFVDTSSDDLRG